MCGICIKFCPRRAIFLRKNEDVEQILFDYRLCDGCKGEPLCQRKCPEGAVSLSEISLPGRLDNPRLLIEGTIAVCSKCGAQFGATQWVDAVLRKTKMDPEAVREICPSCRRKKLLETSLRRTGKIS